MDCFRNYHPIVNLIYFLTVLAFTMFIMHPVMIVISLFCGTFYLAVLRGVRSVLKRLIYMAFMVMMIIIINPLFNHEGVTILFYMKNGNPITKESIVYGVFMALMMMSVMMWFGCFNEVMDTDKFVYLFGRIMPKFSLVLSMTLRFIPRFRERFVMVRNAQKGLGKDITDGNLIKRISNLAGIISIMVSWSLENSVETSDSMKARGYGLVGRTAFSIYRFSKRDMWIFMSIIMMSLTVVIGIAKEFLYYRYYPTFEENLFGVKMILLYMVFALICIIPIMIDKGGTHRRRENGDY